MRGAASGRRRRDLPARRRAPPRGDGGARRPHGRGGRRPGRHLRAAGHRPAAAARLRRPALGRGHRRRRPARRPGRALRASSAGPRRASRSRCATSTTWPATRARVGRPRCRRRSTTDVPGVRRAPARRHHGLGWLAAADEVAAAELRLKFRTGGLEAAAFPAAHALAALDRRGARPRDAVQVHGRAAPRRPAHRRRTASSTTASSTCWSPPGCAFDGAAVDDAVVTCSRSATGTRWSPPPRSSTSPARAGGSPRSAPARSPSRWADLRELGLVA